ncbi:hypothetical protein [Arthrobacter ramosus]|uniref:Hypervirulence associated protein TUDOR domain-containing protein n=1 Tax=Arthrobacter ramosus TaxID=1672 RepID=A0ABV5XWS1_ARTRM|nr:hypothetical protein [Arthrobacter ramosus]
MQKKKKKTSEPLGGGFTAQDWTGLLPGQRVWVRSSDGASFAAVVETKTSSSNAVWIVRDDNLNTRQVFIHIEGIQLLPIEHDDDPRAQSSETHERNISNGI